MNNFNELLAAARTAYARRDWVTAREAFSAAGEHAALSADDTSLLGQSAWWLGRIDESLAASERAFRLYLDAARPVDAAAAAMGIAYSLSLRGEMAAASGWMS